MRIVIKKGINKFSVFLRKQFIPFSFIPNAYKVGDELRMVNTSFVYVGDVRCIYKQHKPQRQSNHEIKRMKELAVHLKKVFILYIPLAEMDFQRKKS